MPLIGGEGEIEQGVEIARGPMIEAAKRGSETVTGESIAEKDRMMGRAEGEAIDMTEKNARSN